jgi:hypothetical protein
LYGCVVNIEIETERRKSMKDLPPYLTPEYPEV